jgi:hypothetical protein
VNKGWPELYINSAHDRRFGDFPAKNAVYTPYIYGSDQPYDMNIVVKSFLRAQASPLLSSSYHQVKAYDKTRTSAERSLEAKDWVEAEATFIKGLNVSV